MQAVQKKQKTWVLLLLGAVLGLAAFLCLYGTAPLNPDRTAWDRMGYRERLALKRENPEAYREMKKY